MSREKEFVNLIRQHEGIIFKITSIYADNGTDQQDLYQEIVYQLWKSYDSFRKEARFSTWMYRVALNTALKQIKKSKSEPEGIPVENVVLGAIDNYDPVFEDRLRQLYKEIGNLDLVDKAIMFLLLESKSYQEIAEITGLSPTNVRTRISRIKIKLKKQMVNN